jgi:hypothetical protein
MPHFADAIKTADQGWRSQTCRRRLSIGENLFRGPRFIDGRVIPSRREAR